MLEKGDYWSDNNFPNSYLDIVNKKISLKNNFNICYSTLAGETDQK